MNQPKIKFQSIPEYHSMFPENVKNLLDQMRNLIQQAAPGAKEVISYNMPAFRQHGILVYYAAAKNHIGFYPSSSPIHVFKKELAAYKTSKGAIQFQLDQPLPIKLVQDIVKYRVNEDMEMEKSKTERKKK